MWQILSHYTRNVTKTCRKCSRWLEHIYLNKYSSYVYIQHVWQTTKFFKSMQSMWTQIVSNCPKSFVTLVLFIVSACSRFCALHCAFLLITSTSVKSASQLCNRTFGTTWCILNQVWCALYNTKSVFNSEHKNVNSDVKKCSCIWHNANCIFRDSRRDSKYVTILLLKK